MQPSSLVIFCVCAAAIQARADFSYTTTNQTGPAGGTGQVTKHYLKGQKMMTDLGSRITVIDFDAQTVTHVNKEQKTYHVTPFAEMGEALRNTEVEANIDIRETGQHKKVGGYDATEAVMTMSMELTRGAQSGTKAQMEMEMWVSPDVPGAGELRAFYKKNEGRFPWAAMLAGGNPAMQKNMIAAQKKIASMPGVPVLQVIRMKMPTMPGQTPEKTAQMQAGMAQARAKLEEMAKQGGPGAAAAQQALARMGGVNVTGGGFEMTMESRDFSTAGIPDAVFAIPAGYQKSQE